VRVGEVATLRLREVVLEEAESDDEDAIDAMFFAPTWSLASATGSKVWESCEVMVMLRDCASVVYPPAGHEFVAITEPRLGEGQERPRAGEIQKDP
jgi:hypothetical protein